MTTKSEFVVEVSLLVEALVNVAQGELSSEKIQSAVGTMAALQGILYTVPDVIFNGLTEADLSDGLSASSVIATMGIAADIGAQLFVAMQTHYYFQNPNPSVPGVSAKDVVLADAKLVLMGILLTTGLVAGIPVAGISIAIAVSAFVFDLFTQPGWLYDNITSPLVKIIRDPLVLDLEGDGIELSALDGSTVHFDYNQDGFSEKTGWVSSDDGILAIDSNGNGAVDGAAELFGSPDQDGFAVLEALDSNGDGKIDVSDERFEQLRIWRDLDQDGQSDAGELVTLTEAGIASISLVRTAQDTLNNGHTIGYEAIFTKTDGSTGITQSVYFQTDLQDTTGDHTPEFTVATGVEMLPQLAGSGQINSIAWMATQDADFRTSWTALTDSAATLSFDQLRSGFEALLLKWAGVDGVDTLSRGAFVDARHLAFVEKFFGSGYLEVSVRGSYTSPSTQAFGLGIEASFDQVVDLLLNVYLAQVAPSVLQRGGDVEDVLSSPYFAYAVLDFQSPDAENYVAPPTPGNVAQAVELMIGMAPAELGAAAIFLEKGLAGLNGLISIAFKSDRDGYVAAMTPVLAAITDPTLRAMATAIVGGEAAIGSAFADGLVLMEGDNLFVGGHGDDTIVSGAGSDLYLFSIGDGQDYIRDTSKAQAEVDTLLLTDRVASDLIFERIGNALQIRFLDSTDKIVSEDFFKEWGTQYRGIDKILLADGKTLSRTEIAKITVAVGESENDAIVDTLLNDTIRGGGGDDSIRISTGSDKVVYAIGDGYDLIDDTSGLATEIDVLKLSGLLPSDVELSRRGDALVVLIRATGETITSKDFFQEVDGQRGHFGINRIDFEKGISWNREVITREGWIRGNSQANSISGSDLDDVLEGRAGSDTIAGQQGSDTYIWSRGDGSDTISESNYAGSTDILKLKDVRSQDVEFFRQGTTLVVHIKPTGETIRIVDQFYSIDNIVTSSNEKKYGIEKIEFSNGVEWGRAKFMSSINSIGLDTEDFLYTIDGGFISDWFLLDEMGNQFKLFNLKEAPGYMPNTLGGVIGAGTDFDDAFSYFVQHPASVAFDAGDGNDIAISGFGNDTLLGGRGDDILHGRAGHDYLSGDDGDDRLLGEDGNDYLAGGNGSDQLSGGDGDDILTDSSAGMDMFQGGRGDDLIVSDAYVQANGNDVFIYKKGDGNDVIVDASRSNSQVDVLQLSDLFASNIELSRSGSNLIVTIIENNQTITSQGFFDGNGENGDHVGVDVIEFADGSLWNRDQIWANAWLRGDANRNQIETASLSDDTFEGGRGNDVLISSLSGGKNGNDNFVYSSGDGDDVLIEASRSNVEKDRLILTDLNQENVQFSRYGDDLKIKDLITGSVIVSFDNFSSVKYYSKGLEEIKFADGTLWDRQTLFDNSWNRGTVTSDILYGNTDFRNVFSGGLGNDFIISALRVGYNIIEFDPDIFRYKLGDGNDKIYDGGHSNSGIDTLILEDIDSDEVTLSLDGVDLIIKFNASGEQIRDLEAFDGRRNEIGLDQIDFADGITWSREDITYWATKGSAFYVGTTGADTIVGSHFDQRLSGNDGNDFIDGKGGSDLVFGDAGSDTLSISVSNVGDVDTIDGGAGADTITLSEFGSAVSIDFVSGEVRKASSNVLLGTIVAVESITGSAFDDVLYGDDGANTILGGVGNDTIDGRSGNDTLKGQAAADLINGYIGNDMIEGGDGNDNLYGGIGNDTFTYSRGEGFDRVHEVDGEGTADVFRLKVIDPAQISFMRDGDDLRIIIAESTAGASDNGVIRLVGSAGFVGHYDQYGIESIVFDNSVTWTSAYLRQLSVYQSATDGDDVLTGTSAAGDFGGGKGNDALAGGGGNDRYLYTRGDGHDTITEGFSEGGDRLVLAGVVASQVSLERNGLDVKLVIAASAPEANDGGSILLKTSLENYHDQGVETIVFADGAIRTMADLRLALIAQASTAENDIITGFQYAEDITAGLGNDSINGKTGNDKFYYARGDGNDIVTEELNSGTDDRFILSNISASEITLIRNGTDIILQVAESSPCAGDKAWIILKDSIDTTTEKGIEKIVFADGTTWSRVDFSSHVAFVGGTNGNDTITGTAGADTIMAGVGDDRLVGLAGNDTYEYYALDGSDVIDELSSGTDRDILKLNNLNQSEVVFERPFADLTRILLRVIATGATITLDNQFDQEDGVEKIIFADGTIFGGDNWSLDGLLASKAVIYGTSGNDTIYGSTTTNDTLDSGAGDDYIAGEEGSDTYIYALGYGNDFINEKATGTDKDTLKLVGLNQTDIAFERPSADLTDVIILIKASGETLTLDNQFDQEDGVEKIVFENGTVLGGSDWSLDGILANLVSIVGTNGNETVTGYANKNDIIVGKGGNDTLTGGTGSDTFRFGSGFGKDTITDFVAGAESADVISFDQSLFADFSSVMAASSQVGVNTVIAYDVNNTITLKNVTKASLHSDDFMFMVA